MTMLTIGGTASAAFSDCADGRMCMWGNNDFVWKIGDRAADQPIANLSGDADNQMDSWANRNGMFVGCMWSGYDGLGDPQRMASDSNDNNVSPLNSDQVSSWRTRYGC